MPQAKVLDIAGTDTISQLIPDFQQSLRAQFKSPRTIEAYCEAAGLLDQFLAQEDLPREVRSITRSGVEAFIDDQLRKWRPATAAVRFRSVQAFFKWCVGSGEIAVSPMAGMSPPKVVPPEIPIVGNDDLRKLLKVCQGQTFPDYRDASVFRLFIDTGCRLSEITGLRLADVDLDACEITVLGKGRKVRRVPFGNATRTSLRRYLRARTKHSLASSEWFWLGARGQQLTPSGVQQLLRRRCREARIPEINPHTFRHLAAHDRLAGGMSEGDAMKLFGWKSREMTSRYGAAAASDRALAAARLQGFHGDAL